MIRWLLRWPAQASLVAVLVTLAVSASLLVFFTFRGAARDDAIADTLALLEQLGHEQARELATNAELGDELGLQRTVTRLAVRPEVREAWWVDEEGQVRASLRRSDLGAPLDVALARAAAPEALKDRVRASIFDAAAHRAALRLDALMSATELRLPLVHGGLGHLVVLGDATPVFDERMGLGYQRLGFQLVVTVVLAAVLWALLERLWVRRSRALQAFARRIQREEADPPEVLAGGDELADIARAMAATGRALHADARLLRALSESSRLALRFPDVPTLFEDVRRILVEVGGFAGVTVFLADGDGWRWRRLDPTSGATRPGLPSSFELDAAPEGFEGLVDAVARGQVRVLDSTALGGRCAVLPLNHPGAHLGALLLHDARPEAFSAGTLAALASVASDLSLSLAHRRVEARATEAHAQLDGAVAAANLGVWQRDERLGRMTANDRWFAMLGHAPRDTVPIATWRSWLHPDDLHRADEEERRAAARGHDDYEVDIRVRHADGHWVWLHKLGQVVERDADGRPRLVRGVALDISERRRGEEARHLAQAIVENTREGILVCDADGVILSVNRSFETVTGFTAEDVVGHRASVLASGLHGEEFYERLWADLHSHGHWEGEIWNRRKNGEVFPEWLSISHIPGGLVGGACFVGQFSDISERQETLRRLDQLSRTDPLTGLDNRRSFLEAAQATLAGIPTMAVLCVNLDGFRQVNQSLGLQAGDAVLRGVAERLRNATGKHALLGRLEGDLFAIALPAADAATAETVVATLYDAFRTPIAAGDTTLVVGLSIGLALAPEHGRDADALLVAAGAAVHEAHQAGRNTMAMYVPGLSAASRERLTIESQLRLALQNGELFLVFQPQVALRDGRLIGVEALVRWRHPTRGVLAPAAFIEIAEDTGLIVPLGEFVLREACIASLRLQAQGFPVVPMSVNVSALQFRRDGFMPTVMSALRDSGLPPYLLELELTESVLMRGTEDMLARMHLVREQGVRVAIDAFGTGFSSLSYLARMGLDRLKIDQSFVRDMRQSVRAEGIVKAILALARHLGISAIAEGVERPEDAAHLLALGCDDAQGYFYGRPMEEAALLDWTRGSRRMGE